MRAKCYIGKQYNNTAVVPNFFSLGDPFAYWAIGHSSPLGLQSYKLYRAADCLREFQGSPGWFPWLPQGATAYSLGNTA